MKRMYVISLDAFGSNDLEYAKTLPHFKYLLSRSALAPNVKAVYPSLTYVCHTSISTGMLPNRHGIINNSKNWPLCKNPDWYWFDKDIKTATFFDVAKKAGYETASFLWPVTGRSPVIDYNLVEIFPNRPWQTQSLASLYAGSPLFTAELNHYFGYLRNGIKQPDLDEFITAGVLHTMEKYRPDFVTIHYVALDSMRHQYGVDSPQAKEAIYQMDQNLGKIIKKLKELGQFEETIIAVLGDHYQLDVQIAARLNTLFVKEGWISETMDNNETPPIYAKEAGGACYIYMNDFELINPNAVYELLSKQDDVIEKIYSKGELQHLGVDENCTFMVEGKEGFYFKDETDLPFAETTQHNQDLLKAAHGYHPDKDHYDTMLFMSGPGIKQEAVIEKASLIDHGPTFMHALGLEYPEKTDGDILYGFFE